MPFFLSARWRRNRLEKQQLWMHPDILGRNFAILRIIATDERLPEDHRQLANIALRLANCYCNAKDLNCEIAERIACKITQVALFALDPYEEEAIDPYEEGAFDPYEHQVLEARVKDQIRATTDWLLWLGREVCENERPLDQIPLSSVVTRKGLEIELAQYKRELQCFSLSTTNKGGINVDGMDEGPSKNSDQGAETDTPRAMEPSVFEPGLTIEHISNTYDLSPDGSKVISKAMQLVNDSLSTGDRTTVRATRDWLAWLEDEISIVGEAPENVSVYSMINWKALEVKYIKHPSDVLAVWKELGGAKEGVQTDMDTIQWFRVPWASQCPWAKARVEPCPSRNTERTMYAPVSLTLSTSHLYRDYPGMSSASWCGMGGFEYFTQLKKQPIKIKDAIDLWNFFAGSAPNTMLYYLRPLMCMSASVAQKYFSPEKRTAIIPPELSSTFRQLINHFMETDHHRAYIATMFWVHDQAIRNREALLDTRSTNPILSVTRSGTHTIKQEGPRFLMAWFSVVVPVLRWKKNISIRDIHIILEPLFHNLLFGVDAGAWISLQLIAEALPWLYMPGFYSYDHSLDVEGIRWSVCITLLNSLGKIIKVTDSDSLISRIDPDLVLLVRIALTYLCTNAQRGTICTSPATKALRKFIAQSSLYSLSPSLELEALRSSVEKLAKVLKVS